MHANNKQDMAVVQSQRVVKNKNVCNGSHELCKSGLNHISLCPLKCIGRACTPSIYNPISCILNFGKVEGFIAFSRCIRFLQTAGVLPYLLQPGRERNHPTTDRLAVVKLLNSAQHASLLKQILDIRK